MPIRKYHCSLFPSILGFFYSHEDAKRAVEGLNGALLGSKPLVVVRAQKKIDREEVSRCVNDDSISIDHQKLEGSNLYVKNLNLSMDDRKLKALFSTYGKVTSAKIMRHDDGVKGIPQLEMTVMVDESPLEVIPISDEPILSYHIMQDIDEYRDNEAEVEHVIEKGCSLINDDDLKLVETPLLSRRSHKRLA
nr:polyadenylate-binding protein 6-like isoform X2 [Ipomoea batatas]